LSSQQTCFKLQTSAASVAELEYGHLKSAMKDGGLDAYGDHAKGVQNLRTKKNPAMVDGVFLL
jgi:hypothetical protein